jgi:P-type Cu2+ transporter
LNYASENAVVEQVLSGRPGVLAVDAKPVAQTATVTFDPQQTTIEQLRQWVLDFG